MAALKTILTAMRVAMEATSSAATTAPLPFTSTAGKGHCTVLMSDSRVCSDLVCEEQYSS